MQQLCLMFLLLLNLQVGDRGLQSRQVKHTPQGSINEFVIWKMNLLVVPVTSVKFKSAFLHA